VGLPDPSAVPIDEQPEPRVASVLVQSEPGAVIDEGAIRRIIAGAVPGLAVESVSVVTVARAAHEGGPPLAHLGPIAVTAASETPLRALLGALLTVNVVVLAIAAFVVRRARAKDA
jgi:type III secretory pathway lipoprotein EscJ